MKKSTCLLILATILISGIWESQAQNPSTLFYDYKTARQNGTEPILPDFSYAGYKHGETEIPDVTYKVFDVTDPAYGAVPNDGLSDKAAIESAIAAAEANGSGVVFFPPGKFLINELTDPINQPIVISKGNIVLRGSGSGSGGTELFMDRHMDPANPNEMYSCPFMFSFQQSSAGAKITDITANATRETFSVTVADASGVMPGQWVILYMQDASTQAIADALSPYTVDPAWTTIINDGVAVREIHQVESINGNTITFKEPIHRTINSNYNWELWSHKYIDHVGVEDIAFTGNFVDEFGHHDSALDDSGWSCIEMTRTVNSWVRRCRFSNWSQVMNFTMSANGTAIHNVIDGNGGHTAIKANGSTHILIGLSDDLAGQWHSIGIAGKSSGNVLWRVSWPGTTSFESHANQPFTTLIDRVDGGMLWRYGGSVANQPNHLSHLVMWNFNNTGAQVTDYEFWRSTSVYGRILPPIISGFHGNSVTFVESQLQENESHGQMVDEESLYEEQLKVRFGKLPDWLVKAKVEAGIAVQEPHLSDILVENNTISGFDPYTTSYKMMLPASSSVPSITAETTDPGATVAVIPASTIPGQTTISVFNTSGDTTLYTVQLDTIGTYTETFTNYTADGWLNIHFTGDNDIDWHVRAKRATYLGSGNSIYFYENTTGVTSELLSGGIDDFSVQVIDKWGAGVERKLELLVNDQVVGQMTHTGTEIYTFSVQDLKISGDFTLGIRNASASHVALAIDNISWTNYSADYNAHLSDIKVNGTSIVGFNRDQESYSLEVPQGQELIEATPESSSASYEVIAPQGGYPGTATVLVTAEDGSTKSYTVTLSYPDVRLQSIQVDQFYINRFQPDQKEYTIILKQGTSVVPSITAYTEDPGASYQVNDATELPGTSTIVVTAADGVTQESYLVNFELATFTETFTNLTSSNYSSGNYVGDNNLTVTYNDARLTTSSYQIESETGALRANSSFSIDGEIGIGSLSLQMTRFWYGSNIDNRQLEVLVNGTSVGTCNPIGGSSKKYYFTIEDINIGGDVAIEVRHMGGDASAGDEALAIDNISWTQPTLQNGSLVVAQDTYVEGGPNSSKNYGTSTRLVVKGLNGNSKYDRQSYMMFDLSQLNVSYIHSAVLNIMAKSNPALDYYCYEISDDTWQETTLTWDNQPTLGSLIGTTTINSTDLTWYQYDISDYIKQEFGGDQVASLKMFDPNDMNIWSTIQSKESSDAPYLTIEYVDSTSFESPIAPLKMGESSTDIKQPTTSKLMVYPNPVNKGEQITVSVPKEQAGSVLRITIYNINGQVMKQYSVNDLSSGSTGISLNVPVLNPGIYILVTEGNNNRQKTKLVVR